MRKLGAQDAVALVAQVADALAAAPDDGAPADDARLIRALADRIIDVSDPWGALARAALDEALRDGSPAARAGALALAEVLHELSEP